MIDESAVVFPEDFIPAFTAINDVIAERPPIPKELKVYRKYVPTLMDCLRLCLEAIHMYEQMLERMENDSEGKKWQRWSDKEDELLIELVCDGCSMLRLSTTLGRTPGSIKTRLSKLVGLKRISQKVAGRFIGCIDGEQTECVVDGTVYKE